MDPANDRASARSLRGLPRELKTDRADNYPHPRNGGTRGYPLWSRIRALNVLLDTGNYELSAASIGCHPLSVRRWEQQLVPYRMNGGVQRQQITEADQLLLSICLYIYPDASLDKLCIFIIANGGKVYSRQIVSRRCLELGLTRKRSSREAYEAFSPSSLLKKRWFWNEPPPLGIHTIPTLSLIDIDKTGFYLKDISNKYGQSHTTVRVRHSAHYTQIAQRLNVIIAIEAGNMNVHPASSGSVNLPRRWVHITEESIDQLIFGDFVNEILTDIESHPVADGYDENRCIIWDNLAAHKTAYVTHIV